MGRQRADGITIPVAPSRQGLAHLTGTPIETCIRIMSRWQKEGTVRTDSEGFVLVDRTAVEKLAMG